MRVSIRLRPAQPAARRARAGGRAKALGRSLHDVRIPPLAYPIANGKRRSGKRVLAVGTDCSVGKMSPRCAWKRRC